MKSDFSDEPLLADGSNAPSYFSKPHTAWANKNLTAANSDLEGIYRNVLSEQANVIIDALKSGQSIETPQEKKIIRNLISNAMTGNKSPLNRSGAVRRPGINSGVGGTAGISGVQRSGAVRKSSANSGVGGIAGLSGVSRSNAVRKPDAKTGRGGIAGISGVRRSNAVRGRPVRNNSTSGAITEAAGVQKVRHSPRLASKGFRQGSRDSQDADDEWT